MQFCICTGSTGLKRPTAFLKTVASFCNHNSVAVICTNYNECFSTELQFQMFFLTGQKKFFLSLYIHIFYLHYIINILGKHSPYTRIPFLPSYLISNSRNSSYQTTYKTHSSKTIFNFTHNSFTSYLHESPNTVVTIFN